MYTYQLTPIFELFPFVRVRVTVEFSEKVPDFVYKNKYNANKWK